MTLDEAIKNAKDVAREWRDTAMEKLDGVYCDDTECIEDHKNRSIECAEEFEQLAEWLEELKQLREQLSCEDAISRADIKKYLSAPDANGNRVIYESDLDLLPSVTPHSKTGHWIDIMVGDMPAQACDQCNTFYSLACTGGGHKYCPNCGAKMIDTKTT